MEHQLSREVFGKEITLSTGKLAVLSAGAVKLQVGGTVILATADIDKKETELDYFPLGVEYIEKDYASGRISGSRFVKSEGFPADAAVIKARQIDHTIRSLFPKGFKRAVSVVITVLAYDEVNDPEFISVLGASAALSISGAPFFGPAASVVLGVNLGGDIVVNPTTDQHDELIAEYVFSGTSEKLLNIEGWSDELSEDKFNQMIDKALEVISELNALQTEFAKPIAKNMLPYSELPVDEALISNVKNAKYDAIKEALYQPEKTDRQPLIRAIKAELEKELVNAETGYSSMDIDKAVEYIARKILRDGVMSEDKRVSGRGLQEIRPMSAEVDVLPTVHGSALFTRGLTQSLSITALASTRFSQILDGMEGESTRSFMHQYNMPNFSTGEAGRYNYRPGRREVGHGMIGENGLRKIIASQEQFPYAIRVVSEIMSSNGSTSMAATCAASMSLMASGVPLKRPVGGIGVGLITEDDNEDNYKLLLDIEGIEDFYGDMDFKITGTSQGMTAVQYENKLRGVKPEVLKEAVMLSKEGRAQVLEVMSQAISESRSEVGATAPRIDKLKISPDTIGMVIGPGGKNIRSIIEKCENKVEIDIAEDGTVVFTSKDAAMLSQAKKMVQSVVMEPEIGEVYEGVVDKITDFGAFVDVSPSISGLLHKSEISDKDFVENVNDFLKEKQTVKVKLIKNNRGKMSFTMKGVSQD